MAKCFLIGVFFIFACLVGVINASAGDVDPRYRKCVAKCKITGCVKNVCFHNCRIPAVGPDGSWYVQEPLYLKWKQWDCETDCRYECMMDTEKEREALGYGPVKYHGKWPFKRIVGIEEPLSVIFSVFNLAMHFQGWISFVILLQYKLPARLQTRKVYYEYTSLCHVYGLLAMNSWFWSTAFHSREADFTEKLDYSSAVAFLGYSLIFAILRTFSVRDEAARVMVAAPLVAFVTTHILYLNFYKLDYGLNMTVCVAMGIAQLILWAVWAGVSRHPSKWKLWTVVLGTIIGILLEVYDFPPYKGYLDAHALWHALTIPLTYLWWDFIGDDVELRTLSSVKKVK